MNGVFIPTVDLFSDPDYINSYVTWMVSIGNLVKFCLIPLHLYTLFGMFLFVGDIKIKNVSVPQNLIPFIHVLEFIYFSQSLPNFKILL